jgi:hypothetical protein
MDRAPTPDETARSGEVVDFDEALLDACEPEDLQQLMTEAGLLARAFAPKGEPEEIDALSTAVQSGVRTLDMGRPHARRLAAALRRLTNGARG